MTFLFPTFDHDFALGVKSGIINGGTIPQFHMAHTLESMGHKAKLVPYDDQQPWDADVIVIQSEWYEAVEHKLHDAHVNGAKIVVWLGHFKGGNYSDPRKIVADVYITTWKGPILEDLPYKEKILYFPHAYCTICDNDVQAPRTQLVWFGNSYPLRNESWFDGLPDITRFTGIRPELLGSYYRRAAVCPNLHGDFQKGQVSTHPSRIADKPGFAANERLFHVAGAGGFQVCDWSPLIDELYTDDELVKCRSKQEYHDTILQFMAHPERRKPFIVRALARTLHEHTYTHRLTALLNAL